MNPVSLGAALSGLAVIFGAFGAHALQGRIGYDLLEVYQTGAHYMFLHAFALILFGLAKPRKMWPAWCFAIGIFFFTGSLFALTFTGIRKFGAITPIGGVLFIAGWIGFAMLTREKSKLNAQ